MFNQTRRKFLKGMAYSSALTVGGGISSVAFALSNKKQALSKVAAPGCALPTCDISILQRQTFGKEIVTLVNHTNDIVTLDSITPVGLEHVNGSLMVKINKVEDGALTLQASERLTFEVEAISANLFNDVVPVPNVLAGHLKISSDHAAFNGIIPVTVFDSQAA
jgi:hypothetical protein